MRALLARLFFAILLLASPAAAMQQSDSPSKFNIPWANSAVDPYIRTIPQASQIGVQNCAASLTDGFPPLTFVPASAGGCPPFGKDFNGILKQITQWSRWNSAGAPVFWDSAFSTQIGGYPKGTILQSTVLVGRLWFSTAENNTTNPDATDGSAANWTVLPGTAYPGQLIQTLGSTAPPNTVSANGRTVGNASSNATGRANADAYWLFVRIWTDCPNAQCQLYNSSGGAISRGATAIADWNANTAIATYQMNGAGTVAADTQGGVTTSNLTSAPVVSGSRTVPGSILGENTHTLLTTEIPSHQHSVYLKDNQHQHSIPNQTYRGVSTSGSSTAIMGFGQGVDGSYPLGPTGLASSNITIGSVNGVANDNQTAAAGGGQAHNIVSRSFLTSNWLAL